MAPPLGSYSRGIRLQQRDPKQWSGYIEPCLGTIGSTDKSQSGLDTYLHHGQFESEDRVLFVSSWLGGGQSILDSGGKLLLEVRETLQIIVDCWW